MNLERLKDIVSEETLNFINVNRGNSIGTPLSDFVDNVYVINLDSREDRLNEVTSELSRFNIQFSKQSAVNGKDLPEPANKIKSGHYDPKNWNKGALGLVETTINIIEDAKLNGYDKIIIFEDDVELHDNICLIFQNSVDELPNDWEMFHFGIFHKIKPTRFSKSLVKVNGGVCCHAYMINSNVFDIYLEELNKKNKPIDVTTLEKIHTRGKTYSFTKNLAFQKNSLSNISGNVVSHGYLRGFRISR